ncbi:MAG: hypothetical protein AAF623_22195, partial [Planctomycetota bacterium]
MTTPFRRLWRAIAGIFEGLNPDRGFASPSQRFSSSLLLPFGLFAAFLAFMVQAWPTTRSSRAFLLAVPVMAILLVALTPFFVEELLKSFLFNENKKIEVNRAYYLRQVQEFPDRPWDAEMFARKLVTLKPEDPANRYLLGLALENCDRIIETLDIMTSLASVNQPGYASAHVWLAEYYARENVNLPPSEKTRLRKTHLELAIESEPDNQFALTKLAEFHRQRADMQENGTDAWLSEVTLAMGYLKQVSEGDINVLQISAIGELGELLLQTEPSEKVNRLMSAQLIQLEPIARRNPDEIRIWQTMVKCAVSMKDYSRALDIVKKGFELARRKDVKRDIIRLSSFIYLSSAKDYQDLTQKDDYLGRFRQLAEAIRVNPIELAAYTQILKYIVDGPDESTDPTNPTVNDIWLADALVGSRSPAVVHALLGVRKIALGELEAGRKHWVIAKESGPQSRLVVDNLVRLAESIYSDQIPNLFDMITLAIEMYPE